MAQITVEAELGGTVWKIECKEGANIAQDDPLMMLESMKMEIPVAAPSAGKVVRILVAQGDVVSEGQALAIIETS
ncbi:MAG: biotin/lipoyl-binding carrier protein [Casimicrobiaceae bacterium]